MVERHRLNLSLSGPDYERLVELSSLAGKTPSTLALDVLKRFMEASGAILPVKRATVSGADESTATGDFSGEANSLEGNNRD